MNNALTGVKNKIGTFQAKMQYFFPKSSYPLILKKIKRWSVKLLIFFFLSFLFLFSLAAVYHLDKVLTLWSFTILHKLC